MIGQTISHYKITSKLGEGGMGEVYRAEDTTLRREVALKVLPEQFTQDDERLARFQREAQLLASLNHPNIAAIHGLEQADGVRFLILELVEGETLAERIQKGAIPLEESLKIALQITEALEAAHEKGVIHRDLKPANVKITPEGVVKVLDFGLAKAMEDEVVPQDISQSPTISHMATRAGIILGTAAYMSPEQAKGRPVDKWADVWAFGAVLYEMLVGKLAFDAEDISQILAKVLEREPQWDNLPKSVPTSIRRLLARALTKDLRKRLQVIAEARIVIEEYLSDPSAYEVDIAVAPQPAGKRQMVGWLLPCAIASVIITLMAVWILSPQPVPKPLTRMALVLPSDQQLSSGGRHQVALSPDGTRLVYVVNAGSPIPEIQLYLRAMDQLEATPIRGTAEGTVGSPFFSPGGQWVGFYAAGELKRVSIAGGAPVTLCKAANPYGASWGADDRIVFGQGREGIFQVPAAGGTKELLISVAGNEEAHGPQVLPGGQSVLFTLGGPVPWDDAQIVVQSLESGERKVLVNGGTDARYVSTGHLVYVRAGTLLAVPFDLGSLGVNGDPVPIVQGVLQVEGTALTGAAQFSFSDLGSFLYVPDGGGMSEHRLVWVDRNGVEEPIKAEPRPYQQPRLSPDGRLLALEIEGDIWTYDLIRETTTRVTFDGGSRPAWTPDGKQIVFTHSSGLFRVAVDGSSGVERVFEGTAHHSNAVSPDGQTLLLHAHNHEGTDALTLKLDGQSEPQSWLATASRDTGTAFSPDGKWIVYGSDESGQGEIYVRPFPGPGGKIQVSTDGGDQPLWIANGEIFYKQVNQMIAAQVQTEPELIVGRPQKLFEGQYIYGNVGPFASYDVTPDGQQFVMIKEGGSTGEARQEIIVVQNWFEELKRLVPTGE